jgi:DNA polymerase IV
MEPRGQCQAFCPWFGALGSHVTVLFDPVTMVAPTQKQKYLVTPDWLRDSVARGSPLPCEDYAALPDLREVDEKLSPRSISKSRITSHHGSPPLRSQSPSRATHTDSIPPTYLLPPPVPPPEVKLDHTTRFCCSRASPLVCPNQPLSDALDVLRRSRALESNERSALSYGRAIAVSVILPSFLLFSLNS